jgi:oligopeptide/dipeptide ABC transporter ATP-binding protein
MGSLLNVRSLQVSYYLPSGQLCRAVAGISFGVGPGEILGVLGESGSGKSTLAASLLRLLPPNGEITGGNVLLAGQDIVRAKPTELAKLRGSRISFISQEPTQALHPTMCACDQIAEVLRAHGFREKKARRERTQKVLGAVFSASDLDRIASSYPHQLSGGQRQRVLIAQAIACGPAVIIADEPTASLDPTTQREIVELFKKLRDDLRIAIIFITHNPALLAGFADRVLVLYAGKVAELGPAQDVLFSPQHPYTKALLRCIPQFKGNETSAHKVLPVIPGAPPSLALLPLGCAFEPRCADRMEVCQTREPVAAVLSRKHEVSCFKFTR